MKRDGPSHCLPTLLREARALCQDLFVTRGTPSRRRKPKTKRSGEFCASFRKTWEASDVYPPKPKEGCRSYTLYQEAQDPLGYMFLEQAMSQKHFQQHVSSEHFQRLFLIMPSFPLQDPEPQFLIAKKPALSILLDAQKEERVL